MLSIESVPSSGRGWSVFTLDPGETTGWAWGLFTRHELRVGEREAIQSAKADGRIGHGQISCDYSKGWMLGEALAAQAIADQILETHQFCLEKTGGRFGVKQISIEDFTLRERSKKRNLLSPVRLTSGVLAVLEGDDRSWFVGKPQSPSNAKTTMTDDRLRAHGLWVPGKPHARDALRHLVLAMRFYQTGR